MIGKGAPRWGLVVAAVLVCHLAVVAARPGEMPTLISLINVPATTMELDSAITLTPSATTVTNGEFITVSWSGVSDPSNGDWIGVYSPSTTNVMEHYPIKFQFANHSAGWPSSSGSLRFQLLNLRADYIFTFMRGGIYSPTLAATSSVVSFTDYNKPFQIHTTVTDQPEYIMVMWNTLDSSTPQVYYGLDSAAADLHTVAAETTTYTADDLCGEPATTLGWRNPGLLHSAVIGPLKPGATPTYKVGDPSYGWSDKMTFTAPPLVGPVTNTRIIAFGDLGRGEVDDSIDGEYWRWGNYQPSLWTTDSMAQNLDSFDLVLNIGDTSYADGVSSEWDEFFHQIAPIASYKPWVTCVGNHEVDWPVSYSFFNSTDSAGECGIPQEKRFHLPNQDGPQSPWYSFDFGSVHVTLMSTEHDFEAGSEQHTWIMKDLANINRTKTPWAIFGGHRPFYVDSTWNAPPDGDNYVANLLRTAYEDALKTFKIDLAIFGHHHTYQRTCAVYQSKCVANSDENNVFVNPGAPIYNVIGMAGAPFTTNFESTKPAYMEYVDDQNHGFYRINTNLTTLHAQFVALDKELTETVLDEFFIQHKPPTAL